MNAPSAAQTRRPDLLPLIFKGKAGKPRLLSEPWPSMAHARKEAAAYRMLIALVQHPKPVMLPSRHRRVRRRVQAREDAPAARQVADTLEPGADGNPEARAGNDVTHASAYQLPSNRKSPRPKPNVPRPRRA